MEGVVHEGWLVKSPPEKRLRKAKWRQRWFVLRHSGLLPGQYILEYFTDNSCKKLRGKIDLDHCDQVDVGSTCETKKTSYQFMFDIITPKRTYYLVASTEEEMNKWVDCICTVGGLKLYTEEDYLAPQDTSTGSAGASLNPGTTNLVETKSSSNPYIPISECHTGKPVRGGNSPKTRKFSDLPKESPPPLPLSAQENHIVHERSRSSEFYDIPKPIKPMDNGESKFGTVHRMSNLTEPPHNVSYAGCKTLPPRVNWSTHPADVRITASTVVKRESNVSADSAVYDIVPSLHSSFRKSGGVDHKARDSTSDLEKADASVLQETSDNPSKSFRVPPRPPKPSRLRDRHEYENFEPSQLSSKVDNPSVPYDVPSSVKLVDLNCTAVPPAPSSKRESGIKITASTVVPPPSSKDLLEKSNDAFLDDAYDFPKFRFEDAINSKMPVQKGAGSSQRAKRHAYSNAPPGLFNSKELIFNYEYRPSLMTDYVNLDSSKQEVPDPQSASAIAAASVPYANIPSTSPSVGSGGSVETPPAINRGLKPKKGTDKSSFSFTLQPPPLYKTRANKCSFRRHGETHGARSPNMSNLNGTPPVPNRFRHQPEAPGVSDEDHSGFVGSRRGSTNEEQTHFFMGGCVKRDEIQYLDLDLDSEPSPSPKSPERISATVYKKVDFVKTKAFNEMRQNVEESYRKSQ